jgi:hypothetical protein
MLCQTVIWRLPVWYISHVSVLQNFLLAETAVGCYAGLKSQDFFNFSACVFVVSVICDLNWSSTKKSIQDIFVPFHLASTFPFSIQASVVNPAFSPVIMNKGKNSVWNFLCIQCRWFEHYWKWTFCAGYITCWYTSEVGFWLGILVIISLPLFITGFLFVGV